MPPSAVCRCHRKAVNFLYHTKQWRENKTILIFVQLSIVVAITFFFGQFHPLIDDLIRRPICVFLRYLKLSSLYRLFRVLSSVFTISSLSKLPLLNSLIHLKTSSQTLLSLRLSKACKLALFNLCMTTLVVSGSFRHYCLHWFEGINVLSAIWAPIQQHNQSGL